MNELINFDDVNTKIITIRNQNVILDSDVATLYGVETKRVNEAVRNNPDKFPEGFVIEVDNQEFANLRSKISTTNFEMTRVPPKAFTEQGLYMLATILKSPQATETTLAIVTTFAKIREFSRNIAALSSMEPEVIEPEVIEKTGGLFNEIFFSGLPTSAETSFEFNLGLMKGKRTVKSEANPNVSQNIQVLQREIDDLKKMIVKINERLEN